MGASREWGRFGGTSFFRFLSREKPEGLFFNDGRPDGSTGCTDNVCELPEEGPTPILPEGRYSL